MRNRPIETRLMWLFFILAILTGIAGIVVGSIDGVKMWVIHNTEIPIIAFNAAAIIFTIGCIIWVSYKRKKEYGELNQ